jgi:hypothetical protein
LPPHAELHALSDNVLLAGCARCRTAASNATRSARSWSLVMPGWSGPASGRTAAVPSRPRTCCRSATSACSRLSTASTPLRGQPGRLCPAVYQRRDQTALPRPPLAGPGPPPGAGTAAGDALRRGGPGLRAHITDHPVQAVKDLTGGIGPDRIIDAVGIDAERPRSGPAAEQSAQLGGRFDDERHTTAPQASPRGRPREEDPTGSRRPEDRSAW